MPTASISVVAAIPVMPISISVAIVPIPVGHSDPDCVAVVESLTEAESICVVPISGVEYAGCADTKKGVVMSDRSEEADDSRPDRHILPLVPHVLAVPTLRASDAWGSDGGADGENGEALRKNLFHFGDAPCLGFLPLDLCFGGHRRRHLGKDH